MIRARVKPRRYDESKGCYVYDVSFKTGVEVTPRTTKVAEAFGLGLDDDKDQTILDGFEVKLADGDIVYITGESGSGKSVLLRALREDLGERAIDISEVPIDIGRPIIDTLGATFKDALSLLSRVGLNDAHLMLQTYGELSEGQRYRFRLAKMIESGRRFWLADEFCSSLDRVTAKIVAYNTQRQARRCGATLIAATSHGDLEEDLAPTVMIRKGWGGEIEVEYRSGAKPAGCSVTREATFREGARGDYESLAVFHYRGGRLPVPLKFFAVDVGPDTAGVIAYSYPPVSASGRSKAVGYNPGLEELNGDWAIISRVVLHPKYRSTGLGSELISRTLPLCGRSNVEMVAVMAEYNPFAERAGMRLVHHQTPPPTVTRAVEKLRRLGFNPVMTGSKPYVERTAAALDPEELEKVRLAMRSLGGRYFKLLKNDTSPYVKWERFEAWLSEDRAHLATAITKLHTLNQTKAYLYWSNDLKKGGGG